MSSRRSRVAGPAVAAMFAMVCAAPVAAGTQGICTDPPLLDVAAGSSAIPTPCVAAPGTLILDSLYFQNASLVGGSALAAYPLVHVRLGVASRLEAVVDPPSQVAESALAGNESNPLTHSGYGLNYALAQTGRSAWAAGFTIVPPASIYTPSQTQPKYALNVATAYHLERGFALTGTIAAATSHRAGFGTILPSTAIGADLSPNARTLFAVDVGARWITRRAAAQSFGDVSVERLIYRKLALNVGVGTSFNAVANAKTHYLASGLSFRP